MKPHRTAFIILALVLGLVTTAQARVSNLRYSHTVPSAIKNGVHLEITFDYEVIEW